jgi:hypothetical protein
MMAKASASGYEVRYAVIDTASASTELVAAVTGKRIRVIGFYLTSDVVQLCSLKSATTDIFSFRFSNLTSGGIAHVNCVPVELGYCQTAIGAALNLTQASTNNADGMLQYTIVDE